MEAQAFQDLKQYDALPVGTTAYIAVDDLMVDHDANSRRYSAGKITEMANSLLANGQFQNIWVTQLTHRVIFGYRRVAGAALIQNEVMYKTKEHPKFAANMANGYAYLECKIVPETMTEEEAFLVNIAENDDREDTTPIDRAGQMVRLTKGKEEGGFGYTQAEAAAKMSVSKKVSQSTVSKYLKVMAEAPAWAIKLVHEGKRPMENLIEAVGHPAGSKERDTALEMFKAGETAAKARAKTRTAKEDSNGDGDEDGGSEDEGKGKAKKRGVVSRNRAELMATVEEWAYVEEGQTVANPFEEIWQQFLKFAGGKASAKTTRAFIAERVKAKLVAKAA